MQQLLTTIRESSTPTLWSKGVEISRQGGVQGEASSSDEMVLRVVLRERTVSPVVTLWPEDEDWSCNCGGREDPCEHVIAAVIAAKQALDQGKPLPRPEQEAATVSYRFKRDKGTLSFTRVLKQDGKELPLSASLAALAAGRVRGPKVAANKSDLTVDHLLREQRDGVLPVRVLAAVIELLAASSDVSLDGQPVSCSTERTGFVACVVDEGPGVRLFGKQASDIKELFKNGAALCSTGKGNNPMVLKPLHEAKLAPDELKLLATGQYFGPRELTALASEILPALKQKLPLDLKARNLPASTYTAPYLVWESKALSLDELWLCPRIAYGDPELARLVHGRLQVHGALTPQRDYEQERKLSEQLSHEFGNGLDRELRLRGEEAVAFVQRLQKGRHPLQGDGFVAFSLQPALRPNFKPQLSGPSVDFDLRFEAPLDGAGTDKTLTASPQVVLERWQEGASLVPLLEGGWAPLPLDWLSRYGHDLALLVAARQDHEELPRCLAPSLRQLCADMADGEQAGTGDAGDALLRQFIQNFPAPRPLSLPEDLRAELRGYQREGVQWLNHLREQGMGALLADDMGLGKTLQTLAMIKGRCLVVAPTSVLYNWQAEITKFRPSLEVVTYHGGGRQLQAQADVTLTTYAILRLDLPILAAETWDMVVLDEAQTIKNPVSQVAQAAFQLQAHFRLALSGTPIENRLEDVWSLFHFLNPALLGSAQRFKTSYERPILAGDQHVGSLFRRRLQPFILRRLKEDVATELPPRTDRVLYCDLNDEEQRAYEAIMLSTRTEVIARLQQGGSVMQALEALLRLRQASCHRGLLPGHATDTSSKLDLLLAGLEETLAGQHKALVFSQWTSLLDLVEPMLQRQGVAFLRLDGTTTNRQEIVERFQSDPKVAVLLLSLKAAGVGLNLTAADHVYMLDPWWNPAVEDQAADRAHRIGQLKPVMVNKLVARGTVEEKILALQERKRSLANTLSDGQGAIAPLSRDELLELLS